MSTGSQEYTVTLKEGSSSNTIIWTIDGTDHELKIDECTAKLENKVLGIGEEYRLTRSDDGSLSGFYEIIVGIRCEVRLSPN